MKHDKLIKFIEENVHIDSSETELIEKYFKPFCANKKELLEKENRIARHLYFIKSGFIKSISHG